MPLVKCSVPDPSTASRPVKKTTQSHQSSNSIDFTKKWDLSDVVLKITGTEKLVHANKTILAMHSPFFKASFYSVSAESMQNVIEVQINYWALLEILKILHHVDRNFGVEGHKLYSAKELALLYNAGDACDIPLIRDLCKQQFTQITPKDAFEVSIQLGLHKEKSEILKKMSFSNIEDYLRKGVSDLVLSPLDVAVMLEKCKEAEAQKIRCTSCGSTDVTPPDVPQLRRNFEKRVILNSGNSRYTCNNCRTSFFSKKATPENDLLNIFD